MNAAISSEKTEFESAVCMCLYHAKSIDAILLQDGGGGENFSELSDTIGNVRYHRKNPIVMMSLLNMHAGNKFRSPEGLVLCHPVMLAE
jgi:hypothetical protein